MTHLLSSNVQMDSGKALEENSFSSEMLGLVCHRFFQRKVDEETDTVVIKASIIELRVECFSSFHFFFVCCCFSVVLKVIFSNNHRATR